jgi:hypothetical protein
MGNSFLGEASDAKDDDAATAIHYRRLPEKPWVFTGKADKYGFVAPWFDKEEVTCEKRNAVHFLTGTLKNVVGLGNLSVGDKACICFCCSTIVPLIPGTTPKCHSIKSIFVETTPTIAVSSCPFGVRVAVLERERGNHLYECERNSNYQHHHFLTGFPYPDNYFNAPKCLHEGLICSSCTKRAGWFSDAKTFEANVRHEHRGFNNPSQICDSCMRYVARKFLGNIFLSSKPPSSPESFRRLYASDLLEKQHHLSKYYVDRLSTSFICSWTCAACRDCSSHLPYLFFTRTLSNFSEERSVILSLNPDVLKTIMRFLCLLTSFDRFSSDKNDFCYDWCGLEHEYTFVSPSSVPYPERFDSGYAYF